MTDAIKKGTSKVSGMVAICGNPNCGKTTIFNAITGLSQKVGNYSGVTVERVSGQFSLDNNSSKITIVDVPGTYSLSAFSPDEYIAASALYGGIEGENRPDMIVCVLDATNLDRSLYLILQVLQTGIPIIVVLNMVDISKRKGIDIDPERLSECLGGVTVLPVVGNQGKGIERLKLEISNLLETPFKPAIPEYEEVFENLIRDFQEIKTERVRTRAELIRVLLDIDGPAEQKFIADSNISNLKEKIEVSRKMLKEKHRALSSAETVMLTDRAMEISNCSVSLPKERPRSKSEFIDRFLLNPILGPVILLGVMVLVFQSIFSWSAPFMNLIDGSFGSLSAYVESLMVEGPLRSLLTDGIIGGVGSVLIFLPQIIILFLFISFLEDSGYMARAAFLVDRMFRWCGLSGKSFIPLLSSFACAVPGIMATRTIEDKKLRTITILVAPLMSCSARLPVYTILIAAFIPYKPVIGIINLQGLVLTFLYLAGILVAVAVAFVLNKTFLKAEQGTFLMELPSYKMPTFKATFIMVYSRAKTFVIRAGTVIMAITIIIWALSYFPRSDFIATQYSRQIEYQENLYESRRTEINGSLIGYSEFQTQNIDWYDNIILQISESEDEASLVDVRDENPQTDPDKAQVMELLLNRKLFELTYDSKMQVLYNERASDNLANSYFGQLGRFVEPVFAPLGWDWKITMAVLASFPAREVIIATLGTIYNLGSDVDAESSSLVDKMQAATYTHGEKVGEKVFTPAVAMSIMIFFALCCQCGATLVTIKAETSRWIYAVGTFLYMTVLAYAMAFVVFQVLTKMGY